MPRRQDRPRWGAGKGAAPSPPSERAEGSGPSVRGTERSAGQERSEVPGGCGIKKGAGIVPLLPTPAAPSAWAHADVLSRNAVRKDPDRVGEDTGAMSAREAVGMGERDGRGRRILTRSHEDPAPGVRGSRGAGAGPGRPDGTEGRPERSGVARSGRSRRRYRRPCLEARSRRGHHRPDRRHAAFRRPSDRPVLREEVELLDRGRRLRRGGGPAAGFGDLAQLAGMLAVQGLGDRGAEGAALLRIAHEHAGPRDGLEQGPVQSDGDHQKTDQHQLGCARRHRVESDNRPLRSVPQKPPATKCPDRSRREAPSEFRTSRRSTRRRWTARTR